MSLPKRPKAAFPVIGLAPGFLSPTCTHSFPLHAPPQPAAHPQNPPAAAIPAGEQLSAATLPKHSASLLSSQRAQASPDASLAAAAASLASMALTTAAVVDALAIAALAFDA